MINKPTKNKSTQTTAEEPAQADVYLLMCDRGHDGACSAPAHARYKQLSRAQLSGLVRAPSEDGQDEEESKEEEPQQHQLLERLQAQLAARDAIAAASDRVTGVATAAAISTSGQVTGPAGLVGDVQRTRPTAQAHEVVGLVKAEEVGPADSEDEMQEEYDDEEDVVDGRDGTATDNQSQEHEPVQSKMGSGRTLRATKLHALQGQVKEESDTIVVQREPGVGERTREGNDLYYEMIESGAIKQDGDEEDVVDGRGGTESLASADQDEMARDPDSDDEDEDEADEADEGDDSEYLPPLRSSEEETKDWPSDMQEPSDESRSTVGRSQQKHKWQALRFRERPDDVQQQLVVAGTRHRLRHCFWMREPGPRWELEIQELDFDIGGLLEFVTARYALTGSGWARK